MIIDFLAVIGGITVALMVVVLTGYLMR